MPPPPYYNINGIQRCPNNNIEMVQTGTENLV